MRILASVIVLFLLSCEAVAQQKTTLDVAHQKATIKLIDALSYIESEYIQRFKFDEFDNPKFQELRE